MTPINGVLIGLGKENLASYDATTPASTPIPAGTTHFSFGFGANNKTKTHGHVNIKEQNCILQSGVIYSLHTHSYKPNICKANAADTFEEVSFYRIDSPKNTSNF